MAERLLPDDIWAVIKDYLIRFKAYEASEDIRSLLEKHTEIEAFDGGVFIALGNEFDLFVLPEKRGRWRIRSIFGDYLYRMGCKHGKIVARIDERNTPSLRLARHFGFKEVSRCNGVIRLEKEHG